MSAMSRGAGLAAASIAELLALKRRLEREAAVHLSRLDDLEERKSRADQEGAGLRSLREQHALALQIAGLDRESEQEARLLEVIGRQRALIDRLILARQDAARWKSLCAAAPEAMALDWADLVEAALSVSAAGGEANLNAVLRILGVPEEEWPRGEAAPGVPGLGPAAQEVSGDGPPVVLEVLDGRSLVLATGERVRYIGVDAPLLRGALGHPDAGADEAWAENRRLVEGKVVRLEADSLDQDPDGALWRYVWVGRRCANAEMIRGGYAFHLPQSPNYLHMEWFARLEAEAKRKKRGIWR